jgi:cytochrome c
VRPVLAGAATLWLAAAPAFADDILERGREVFQRCAGCHGLEASTRRMPGPSLYGVIGRRAGTLAGFDFSEAMIAAGRDRNLVWSEATLADYLDDTDAYVPGTAMGYLRITDPDDKQALIAYIEDMGR